MHITFKKAELLKHSKLDKNAPTCFDLHRNYLQGAKVSAWLKITRLVDSICVNDVQGVVSAMEFGFRCLSLQILLNHSAALVLSNFSLVFL